jgi:predicted RNA-binding Zn ribbon-like protein
MIRKSLNTIPSDKGEREKGQLEEQTRGKKTSPAGEAAKSAPRLIAGDVSLDFVNTRHPDDFLVSVADLLQWSQDSELITTESAQKLLQEAATYPEESHATFTQIMALREASYRVVLALIHQTHPATSDLLVLQNIFVQTRAHEQLVLADDHLGWQWEPATHGLTQFQRSLSRSIENILTSPTMERVKECPPSKGGCGWLFVDRSKNRSRQWCSDGECGSRIRMRRLYARKRARTESI